MSKILDQEIQNMKRLINYGVNENKNIANGQSSVEYHEVGADGKTYGIIRESGKFYIKVAPKKDTEVLAEDYDYIGGFGAKKEYEYNSYANAAKNFGIKMKDLNEAYSRKSNVKSPNEVNPSEWMVNETKEMRAEIERMNQISRNVNGILTEGKNFTQEHTLPEAPAKNPSDQKVNSPYTDTAVAKGDKDMKNGTTDYQKKGGPFSVGGTVTNKDMQSDKNPKGNSGETYSEKPNFGPKFSKDGLAAKKNEGGKSVKMNEGKTVKLTEEQVLAWSKSKDFMDKSHGTEIGDSAPFDDEIGDGYVNEAEGTVVHTTDNQDSPKPGVGEIGDSAPFDDEVNEGMVVEVELDDDPDVEDPELYDDDADFRDEPSIDSMSDRAYGAEDPILNDPSFGNLGDDEYDFDLDVDVYDPNFYESKKRSSRRVNEGTVLDDFGKHPAYRKEVMSLPPNKEIDRWGRDWNHKSTKGSEPYGQKIGSSAPYTDDVIDMLTDAVMDKLNAKKKA